jgi:alkylation response protein AidB-like acyl-CoA dehydrogenase
MLMYRTAQVMDKGKAPNIEAAIAKPFCNAFERHLAGTAVDILGMYGQLRAESKYALFGGMAPQAWLASRGYSLQGGADEVLKGIVATRGLRMPTAV